MNKFQSNGVDMNKEIENKYQLLTKELLKRDLLNQLDIDLAIREVSNKNLSLISYLVGNNSIDSTTLAEVVSDVYGIPLFNLKYLKVDDKLKSILDIKYIQTNKIVPLFIFNRTVYIGTSDPTQVNILNDVKFKTSQSAEFVVVEESEISHIIDVFTGKKKNSLESFVTEFKNQEIVSQVNESNDEKEDLSEAPIIQFVNKVLYDAVKLGASDIHFEPYETTYRVRFRVDGMLQEMYKPPINVANKIAARIKVLADIDISERRLPQDGRIKITLHDKKYDFRANTLPTLWGEKLVLRIMDNSSTKITIDQLGFNAIQKEMFLKALSKPQGMILVTGPTGSGKTVTLYTGLGIINEECRNISTAEDPVEMNVEGINQVNVNNKVGLTFASAMKAFLRQDPDTIMIGEIRDLETAEISIKASQTGHLVLSTLHTNSAVETVNRIKQMGIPSYNLATSLTLVIAQRLGRRLCNHCKISYNVSEEIKKDLGIKDSDLNGHMVFEANPDGCQHCNKGYKGRVGLYEMLYVNDEIAEAILNNKSAFELIDIAREHNFMTIKESAVSKFLEGITTVEEIYRVTT